MANETTHTKTKKQKSTAAWVILSIIKRLAVGFAMLLVVSILVFACTQILPGDVARQVLGQNATPEQVDALREQLGLNRPIWVQYLSWLSGILQFNPGMSLASRTPVIELIAPRLANSLTVVCIAFICVLVLSYTLGILAARKPGGVADAIVSTICHFILSLPEFVVGILVIMFLATNVFRLFPPASIIDTRHPAIDQPALIILPIIALTLVASPHLIESVRTLMREELASPEVTWARLSGVKESTIIFRYALPGILAPSLQVVATTVSYLLGGMVAIETVFAFPGIGSALVSAVTSRDIVTVQAIAMFIAFVMMIMLIIADIVSDLSLSKERTKQEG